MASADGRVTLLGSVLRRSVETVRIEPDETYSEVTVRLWGRGVTLRGRVQGSEIAAPQRGVIRAGQFILSRIDARNGAFGIVPPELDGGVVSNDFPAYIVDASLLDVAFLGWLSRTPAFVQICKAASEGTTNRVRLDESKFLSAGVRLPSLDEQRSIVVHIEHAARLHDEVHRLRSEARVLLDALACTYSAGDFDARDGENVVPLGDVARVVDPNPSHRYPVYVPDGVPIISSSEFSGADGISFGAAKKVSEDFYEATLGRFAVGESDVIFSRKGKIGYARLHPPNLKLAMTHTLCVIQPDTNRIHPRYLLHFARSRRFLDYLGATMNPNVGVPTLGLDVIRSAPVPMTGLDQQKQVVARMDAICRAHGEALAVHDMSDPAFEATLPAILEKTLGPLLN